MTPFLKRQRKSSSNDGSPYAEGLAPISGKNFMLEAIDVLKGVSFNFFILLPSTRTDSRPSGPWV